MENIYRFDKLPLLIGHPFIKHQVFSVCRQLELLCFANGRVHPLLHLLSWFGLVSVVFLLSSHTHAHTKKNVKWECLQRAKRQHTFHFGTGSHFCLVHLLSERFEAFHAFQQELFKNMQAIANPKLQLYETLAILIGPSADFE